MIHAAAISALLLGGCDREPSSEDTDRQPPATAGKADAPEGSCVDGPLQAVSCGAQGSGECWCDEQCASYGDCCVDAAEVCGVDTCVPDGDGCGPGLTCIEVDGVAECRAACDLAQTGEGTVACPPQWRLASNSAGRAFCLREGLETNDDRQPWCADLLGGGLGYVAADGEVCPADAQPYDDTDGTICRFEGLEPPGNAEPYCNYVADGYFGYSWEACAPAMVASVGPAGEQRCGLAPERLPVGARAYCDYVADGYFGFYWDLADDPDYGCPVGTRSAPNGAGTGYCLVEYEGMPGHVHAWCDPDAEFVGYEWLAGCGT